MALLSGGAFYKGDFEFNLVYLCIDNNDHLNCTNNNNIVDKYYHNYMLHLEVAQVLLPSMHSVLHSRKLEIRCAFQAISHTIVYTSPSKIRPTSSEERGGVFLHMHNSCDCNNCGY